MYVYYCLLRGVAAPRFWVRNINVSISSNNKTKFKSNYKVRKQSPGDKIKKILIVVGAIVLVSGVAFGAVVAMTPKVVSAVETAKTEQKEASLIKQTSPLKREDIKDSLLQLYKWDMKVVNNDGETTTFDLKNLVEPSIDKLVDEIYDGNGYTDYKLELEMDEELLDGQIQEMKKLWNKQVVNAEIVGYDVNVDQFLYGQGHDGLELNEAKLKDDIEKALSNKKFDATITAQMDTVKAEFNKESAGDMYKIIGHFETTSTNNENRNNNLNLACQAINGKILKPGEEFSFNEATGNRTAAKGYLPAGAYADGGEVVQEEGGGVCQVASTLYNAVVKAGFYATERYAHTYEPTYVNPGEDATVSYDGPDFKFVNTSDATIVVRAQYANRQVTCFLVGLPLLEEGVEVHMESEKVKTIPMKTEYIEDASLPAGTEVVSSKGSAGSTWETELVTTLNGVEEKRERLHSSTYKGHTHVVRRNSQQVEALMLEEESGESDSDTLGPGQRAEEESNE